MMTELPEIGLDMLARSFGPQGYRKTPFPPVVIVNGEPEAVYYLFRDPIEPLPDDTVLVWSWPGQWRNDVYRSTLGTLRAEVEKVAKS